MNSSAAPRTYCQWNLPTRKEIKEVGRSEFGTVEWPRQRWMFTLCIAKNQRERKAMRLGAAPGSGDVFFPCRWCDAHRFAECLEVWLTAEHSSTVSTQQPMHTSHLFISLHCLYTFRTRVIVHLFLALLNFIQLVICAYERADSPLGMFNQSITFCSFFCRPLCRTGSTNVVRKYPP